MGVFIHAADISQQCRPFDVAVQWTYLLFEEFFEQGDMEKEAGLSISMLCDRAQTSVVDSQPGFINFVVAPLWNTLAEFLPALDGRIKCMNENIASWQQIVSKSDGVKKT